VVFIVAYITLKWKNSIKLWHIWHTKINCKDVFGDVKEMKGK
jgi:hypothetical protein